MLKLTKNGTLKWEKAGGYRAESQKSEYGPLLITNDEDVLLILHGSDQSGSAYISLIWSPIDSPQYVFTVTADRDSELGYVGGRERAALTAVDAANNQLARWMGKHRYEQPDIKGSKS